MKQFGGPGARILAAAAGLVLALSACATNPATGGRMLSLVSEGREIEMGQEYKQIIPAQYGLYDDDDLQAYVDSVGQALAAVSERPQLPWSFEIVDDPVINAFALPGGPIYVARGLMVHFNSEAEMASVLGHELGHITARHIVEALSRQQLAQIGLTAGMIAVPGIRPFGDVLGGGLGLLFLKYGRDDESQSDLLGHRYMTRLGYDPDAATDMFRILERQREASGRSIPEWQSSHPDPGNRVANAEERAAADGHPGGIVRRDEYLRRIEGLVYGEDPMQGYFQDDRFLHPDLRFQLDFPTDWQRQNSASAVTALSPDEDAILQLTVAADQTPAQAAEEFFAIESVRRTGSANRTINGLPAVMGSFRAATRGGTLEGLVLFIRHRDLTYQVIGYTSSSRFGRYSQVFERFMESFAPLTDSRLLDVEPKRIDVVEISSSMTAESFHERYPSTIPFDDLLLLNGWAAGERLEAGSLAKRVTGTGGPR
ncbi:MAG: M48 family metalloprotease [Gemmatimonadota bacterium]